MAGNKALFLFSKDDSLVFKTILREFTGNSECCRDGEDHYLWEVENKYYSAKILLRWSSIDECSYLQVDDYDAIVIFTDSAHADVQTAVSNIWIDIKTLLHLVESPPVCIVVMGTHQQEEGEEERGEGILKWCVDNQFELIKWTPSDRGGEIRNEEEDTVGTVRLREALQAHTWLHMEMKNNAKKQPHSVAGACDASGCKELGARGSSPDGVSKGSSSDGVSKGSSPDVSKGSSPDGVSKGSSPDGVSKGSSPDGVSKGSSPDGGSSSDIVSKGSSSDSVSKGSSDGVSKGSSSDGVPKGSSNGVSKGLLSEEEMLLAEGLDGEEDLGGENFEQLFAKFSAMKDHARQLPEEERKKYAEKVVMSFWNAIGGDEEEMRDLT